MIRLVETGGTKSRFGRSLARCVAGAIIVCGGATAQDAKQDTKPFDPKIYPAGVQKVLQQARDECKAESGGEVQFAADTVRALDLTGAGHTDYIVDLHDAACRDREAVYCGTGGCDLYILVTRPEWRHAPRLRSACARVRGPARKWRAHYSLRVARRLLRRPRQSIVHQNAPHHRATVQVRDAAIAIAFAGACRRFGYA